MLALLLALVFVPALAGQEDVAEPVEFAGPSVDRVHRGDLEDLLAGLPESAQDPALLDELERLYTEALVFLDESAVARARALDFESQRLEAPGQTKQLQDELASEQEAEALPDTTDYALTELTAALAQAGADSAAARVRVSELQLRAEVRDQRRAELPSELTEARSRVDTLIEELDAPAVDGASAELITARRLRRAAELQAAESHLLALEQEREAAPLGDARLDLERQRAARRRGRAERLEELWLQKVNQAERAAAERAVRDARVAAAAAQHPAVLAVLEEAQRLAERRTGGKGLRTLIERASVSLSILRDRLHALETDKRSVEAKKDAAGLSQQIGLLMVKHRGELANPADHRASIARRSIADAEIDIERIDLEDDQRRNFDINGVVSAALAELSSPPEQPPGQPNDPDAFVPPTPEERARIESAMREALVQQARFRDDLLQDLRSYTALLQQLNAVESQLADKTEAFAAFIDEHVLWVRIADPIYSEIPTLLLKAQASAGELLDTDTWGKILARSSEVLPARAPTLSLKVLLLVLLFASRRGLRRRIADDAYLVARLRTDQFIYTIRTLLATLLLALPTPVLLYFASGMLDVVTSLPASDAATRGLARAAAQGLGHVATVLLVTNLLWATCRPKGLAEAHFRWPSSSLKLLRRHLRWLVPLCLPLVFLFRVMSGDDTSNDASVSLGRLALIAGQLTLLVFAWCVLRPESGVFAPTIEKHPTSWVARLSRLWFGLAVGVPGVLVVMSALGYLYTANQLQARFTDTTYLILVLILLHALLTRWLFVARRRLALAQYRKRRAAAQEKVEGGAGASVSEEFVEDDVDIPSLSEQSETLVQTLLGVTLVLSMGLIWADVLPALGFLDGFALWEHTVDVEQAVAQADGTSNLEVVKQLVPVTLADVIAALVALALTVIAARNLPGLLEIMVLQRLPMQRAGRYAVTTISRYLIVVIGLALMFNAVGIGWSKVQWLAAAVSVGLGFGLQEIFANFVSGLIILFERPIRVGDTVTVGTITGSVSRIHMRATTIITWDRTELIVPNREFITNQLVNWTLSDSVLRVIVKVGIAYGSDTAKAEQLLHEIAREHPDVLTDPAPRVIFTSFGDSTLDFELRMFVTDPELFRTIHHPINNAIDRRFKENGIEIAFPQRDLHLRTSEAPLTVIRPEDIQPPPAAEPAGA
ncbi:MAG: potassium transporter [Planctomycetota bacterium]|nr:MAG: potassium transporter [Planctomycetota bacterium]